MRRIETTLILPRLLLHSPVEWQLLLSGSMWQTVSRAQSERSAGGLNCSVTWRLFNVHVDFFRKDGAVKGLCGGEVDPLNLFAFGDLDGEGRAAKLQHPLGVAVGEKGTVYVADSYNHKLKKVEMEGAKARVVSMKEGLNEPGGISMSEDQQKLYIADSNAHIIQVSQIQVAISLSTASNRCIAS